MAKARTTSNVDPRLNDRETQIWDMVSRSPVHNLWDRQGVPVRVIAGNTWKSIMEDRLFGHAAELAFYFLFSLFPTLICASAIFGLAAQSAQEIYFKLLHYFALVIPTSALGTVLKTFNETTAASSSGKITFGLIAAIWSASVGLSAVQDTLNAVYKLVDRRSYILARLHAIGMTIVLIITMSLCLGSLLASDLGAAWLEQHIHETALGSLGGTLLRIGGWIVSCAFLAFSFSITYYWAPDLRKRRWHWLAPGTVIGMIGWLLASIGLRVYLHYFNNYTVTYGSLGAVIILLTWFYITGLMLLLGAEVNSEIEAAAVAASIDGAAPAAESIMSAA